ncbi:hypothetical protein H8356DRAFT_1743592 [Neocallimastix lanati (nom. inval.)]|nr:hypothetical protein H8356DRAFT_1743592 [Neocallimastix sp. JGI-2020a]
MIHLKRINSTDRCIYIKDKLIRKRVIAYRLNAFGISRICSICHNVFQRDHINKCDFVT